MEPERKLRETGSAAIACPYCNDPKLHKSGVMSDGRQKYKCITCKRVILLEKKGNTRPTYTIEQKAQAIAMARTQSLIVVAQATGITTSTIARWRTELGEGPKPLGRRKTRRGSLSKVYEVVDGKMPEEFHKKHLLTESVCVIEIKCNNCSAKESVNGDDVFNLTFESETMTLDQYAARSFYESEWRYCVLPDYEIEGVFCPDCIRENDGTESNSLRQPREKVQDD